MSHAWQREPAWLFRLLALEAIESACASEKCGSCADFAMCDETGHREIILRFRHYYIGRLSRRLVPAVPYQTPPGIRTIIDHLAKTHPKAKGLKEIEDSGIVKRLLCSN